MGFFKNFLTNRITLNVIGGAVLILGLVIGAHILLGVVTKHNQEIAVPDLTNMSVGDAQKLLAKNKMRLDVVDSVYVRQMGKGLIYRQNPKAGSKVKERRCIHLTINAKTAKKVTMPNLVGYSMRQAKAELRSKGLLLGNLIYEPDLATNNVLRQLYHGREIAKGTPIESGASVDLAVGLNPDDNLTYLPDVTGLKYLDAVDAVHDNSLNIKDLIFDKTVKDYNDSLSAMVYMQSPAFTVETTYLMGTGIVLYLTVDENRIPKLLSAE